MESDTSHIIPLRNASQRPSDLLFVLQKAQFSCQTPSIVAERILQQLASKLNTSCDSVYRTRQWTLETVDGVYNINGHAGLDIRQQLQLEEFVHLLTWDGTEPSLVSA